MICQPKYLSFDIFQNPYEHISQLETVTNSYIGTYLFFVGMGKET